MNSKMLVLVTGLTIVIGYFSFSYVKQENFVETPEIVKPIKIKEQPKTTTSTPKRKSQRPISFTSKPYKAPEEKIDKIKVAPEPLEGKENLSLIKEQIYEIAVEYTDDLELLDEIVQDSADEPVSLWEGDWVSADDWKRSKDIFTIEKNDDGTFELTPGRDSSKSYSYNEETKEFVWELDYYGKIVTHKARFISDDVMVLMKISGIKVALDIYKRDAG